MIILILYNFFLPAYRSLSPSFPPYFPPSLFEKKIKEKTKGHVATAVHTGRLKLGPRSAILSLPPSLPCGLLSECF